MVEQPRLPLIPPGSYAVQYRAFQEAEEALNECEVMRKVFPLLAGSSTSFSSSGSHSFRNLENLINGTIVDVKPDIYDRADPNQIDQGILAELDLFIRPLAGLKTPAVPNFFAEFKGPKSDSVVAGHQAYYAGAIGARAIHKLRSFAVENPEIV